MKKCLILICLLVVKAYRKGEEDALLNPILLSKDTDYSVEIAEEKSFSGLYSEMNKIMTDYFQALNNENSKKETNFSKFAELIKSLHSEINKISCSEKEASCQKEKDDCAKRLDILDNFIKNT